MKRVIIVAITLLFSLTASAQLKVVKMMHQADTLIYTTARGMSEEELIDIYKGPKGYLIKVTSTNMFDDKPKFYIGKTKEEAKQTLIDLANMCDCDVATSAIVEDSEGITFVLQTTYMANKTRKSSFVKSDRVYAKNEKMAGWMCLKKKILEEAINALNK